MKVLYNTCFADPWLQVAQKLQQEKGFEPVYWIGYEDDNSQELIPKTFPNVIYHPYYDAWAAKFPEIIEKEFSRFNIDIEFINKYAKEELLAYKMMDRMDPYRNCFNFMERQSHFRKLLRYWCAVLETIKPDIVISASIPHRVYDYVLYLLCQDKNIPFLSFMGSHFKGRIIPLTTIISIGKYFDNEYLSVYNSTDSDEDIKQRIDPAILSYYEKIQLDYSKGQPEFVSIEAQKDKKSSGIISLTQKFFNDIFVEQRKRYLGPDGILKSGVPVYLKLSKSPLKRRNISIIEYARFKSKTNKYKKQLKKYYNKLASPPDLNKKYLLFNLHYQPEATSSPAGGVFVDLSLIVNVLAEHLPADYFIYIKEHPAQYHAHREGHTSRMPTFYNAIKSHKNVRLLPLDYDPFMLIKHASAIATISGSVGWEAMVLRKPVISFGLSWYEKYPDVFRITDSESASKIADFIENFSFDERKLLAYLAAFSAKAIKAYYYRGLKQKLNQPEEECVHNLSVAILETLKHV